MGIDKSLFKDFVDACELDQAKANQLLIQNPSFIKDKGILGESAIMFLVTENYLKGVQFLLEKGADVNELDDLERTLLDIATTLNYQEMVKLLLKYGGRPGSQYQ